MQGLGFQHMNWEGAQTFSLWWWKVEKVKGKDNKSRKASQVQQELGSWAGVCQVLSGSMQKS